MIAFNSLSHDGLGGYDVYLMNADGTDRRRLTRGVGFHAWSPDGRKIAFFVRRDGNVGVYVMNADGSGERRLTRNPAGETALAWSPDGRKLAFDGNGDLFVMNADGQRAAEADANTRSRRLSGLVAGWRKIAFLSLRDGKGEVTS